jgi:nucleoside phosphorylase
MRKAGHGLVNDQQAAYLQLLISDRDADSRKLALETIAKLYRSGLRFKNLGRILPHVIFLCQDEHEKVRRWAFNALALVGTKHEVPIIISALEREAGNPDVLAAVIVALSALADEDTVRMVLKRADLPLEGFALLAAAQQSVQFSRELAKTRIDIEAASVSELRLATLLLGLRKAPENMLSANHMNRDVIGTLNFYPDDLVSQYSVWAAYEDPEMSLGSLRIQPKDIGDYHEGIRKYAYRLMTASSSTALENRDYILNGSTDNSREAREGLATGLRNTYFSGLEEITLPWFADEESETVRSRLLEHMAGLTEKCASYSKPVTHTYEQLNAGSLGRARLEAAAAGTPLFPDLKRIEYQRGMADMFGQSDNAPVENTKVEASMSVLDAKILIVTALPKEAAAVIATFDEHTDVGVEGDTAIYRLGRFISKSGEVRSALTVNAGMGKVRASTLGANAIRSFPHLRYIVMIGIAGGCPNPTDPETHVRLGDAVVSRADAGVLEYDFIKKPEGQTEIRRFPQAVCAKMSSAMGKILTDSISGLRPWEDEIDRIIERLGASYARPDDTKDVLHDGTTVVSHPVDAERRSGRPKIIEGTIGSADILQKDPGGRDALRDEYGVRAIEMEASGLQGAAWTQGRDIYVIRGICDYCDRYKTNEWQSYAAAVAAALGRGVIESMPLAWL